MEQWRNIKGYDGFYEVNSKSVVRSVDRVELTRNGFSEYQRKRTGKVIRQFINKFGYPFVILSKNGKKKTHLVHSLVADAFPEICGVRFEGAEVNHKNEVKTDNRPENLEFVTRSGNMLAGTVQERRRKKMEKAINQYDMEGNFIKKWASSAEIREVLGYTCIGKACRGVKNYEHPHGFIWKYAD